jgi:four helix bundle protein
VAIRKFEDLDAWRLSFELQREVFAITAYGSAWQDLKFREQIRDAAASAPRNIAEGFGRYRPREFARFLHMARGSLHETRHHLHDALQRSYLTAKEHDRLVQLSDRAIGASTALLHYLNRCDANGPARRPASARKAKSHQ